MNSSYVITTQPVFSHQDKTSPVNNINSHKNSCEKFCTCNSTENRWPVNCDEFCDTFKLGDDNLSNGAKQFGFYSCCCLPFTLPLNSLLCGPCVLYNVCRNKCAHNEEDKNYLC